MAAPTEEELKRFHQWFAVECNNKAWGLALAKQDPQRDLDLLNHAHASVYHWLHVGKEIHRIRGLSLLAHAHASVGLGSTALSWAREVSEYFTTNETEAWEMAFTHMIHAQAAHVVGETNEYQEKYAAAKSVIDEMPDGQDKNTVLKTWALIPQP